MPWFRAKHTADYSRISKCPRFPLAGWPRFVTSLSAQMARDCAAYFPRGSAFKHAANAFLYRGL
jgi:hypothetical protein